MKMAETKVSVHSSHHTPLGLVRAFLFEAWYSRERVDV
jgi:hypothetical protein